jgi:hypothetical protein
MDRGTDPVNYNGSSGGYLVKLQDSLFFRTPAKYLLRRFECEKLWHSPVQDPPGPHGRIPLHCFSNNATSYSAFLAEHGHILSCCSPYIELFQALAKRLPIGQDKPGASTLVGDTESMLKESIR